MKKVLLIGEPLIRITPTEYNEIGNAVENRMYFGGSEINIACNLQGFGLKTKILTALPSNPVGDRFLAFLEERGVDTSSIQRCGERVGLYYLEDGFGCRATQVYYDRSHTAITQFDGEQVDMDQLFEDVGHLHFSGITVALGEEVRSWLTIILTEAQKRVIPISFDLNWRSKMIGLEDAKYLFSEFANYATYCFGIEPIMASENNLELFDRNNENLEALQERLETLKKVYDLKAIFHTLRETDEYGNNTYQAYALTDTLVQSLTLKTPVLQRVGSGDAFVAGALYQLLQGVEMQEVVDFAVASGTYKCSVEGDFMTKSPEKVAGLLKWKSDIVR